MSHRVTLLASDGNMFSLDLVGGVLVAPDGTRHSLRARQVFVLRHCLESVDQSITRDDWAEHFQGRQHEPIRRSPLDTTVSSLRRMGLQMRTVTSVGYRLDCRVARSIQTAAPRSGSGLDAARASVLMVLDASGSIEPIADDTAGGLSPDSPALARIARRHGAKGVVSRRAARYLVHERGFIVVQLTGVDSLRIHFDRAVVARCAMECLLTLMPRLIRFSEIEIRDGTHPRRFACPRAAIAWLERVVVPKAFGRPANSPARAPGV